VLESRQGQENQLVLESRQGQENQLVLESRQGQENQLVLESRQELENQQELAIQLVQDYLQPQHRLSTKTTFDVLVHQLP
jgi:hypothetical protein